MEGTISVKQIIIMLVKHIKLILILAIIFGGLAYFYAINYVTPQYTSSGTMYVQNKVTNSETTSSGDLAAASRLATACSHIFTTQKVLEPISTELKEEYGLNLSTGTLRSMISVSTVEGSELLSISVKGSDPVQVYRVCSMVVDVIPDAYKQLIYAGTMIIVDEPRINYSKTNSSETSTAVKGIAVGAVIGIVIAFLIEFLNKEVKPDDDLYEIYGIPVFAEILNFDASPKVKGKYGRYSKYGRYGRYGNNAETTVITTSEEVSKETDNKSKN